MTKEAVASTIESIRVKRRQENLYGTELMDSLATVSSTDALSYLVATFIHNILSKEQSRQTFRMFLWLDSSFVSLSCLLNYKN